MKILFAIVCAISVMAVAYVITVEANPMPNAPTSKRLRRHVKPRLRRESGPIAIGSVIEKKSVQLNTPPPGKQYIWTCSQSTVFTPFSEFTSSKACWQLVPIDR
ncbi:hypothetical protein BDF19DRAFT_439698 [Syncephalis fuscata]|nr:hypothetical protein BDF19DRAFT_439698 [Syncephalis fuscata]